MKTLQFLLNNQIENKILGLVRESNPGPLAPKARIIPLDQQADCLRFDDLT